jgi:hypothetical protein
MRIKRAVGVVVAALFFAAALVADVNTSTLRAADGAPGAADKPAKQIRGFSMQFTDPKGVDGYMKAVDDIAAMGCTAINFAVSSRQEQIHSETLAMDWTLLPPQRDVEKVLRHAKEKGIFTIMMPMVLLRNSGPKEWRGVIDPPDWATWFDSYRAYMVQMAKIAQRCDVDLLCVGSELLSTEGKKDEWTKTITAIRAEYKGKLTYSANWDSYTKPTFWDQLDYIGMNNYNELVNHPGASVEEIVKKWDPIKTDVLAFSQKMHKPFFFTEVGWHNLKNTLKEPWNYVAEGPIDLDEQLHAYQAFVQAWKDVPTTQYMGALIWEWYPGIDGSTWHGAYSLQNTPALDVVKKWMVEKQGG